MRDGDFGFWILDILDILDFGFGIWDLIVPRVSTACVSGRATFGICEF
jgi:hypothetical protein